MLKNKNLTQIKFINKNVTNKITTHKQECVKQMRNSPKKKI